MEVKRGAVGDFGGKVPGGYFTSRTQPFDNIRYI